jgi:hypothetical protein
MNKEINDFIFSLVYAACCVKFRTEFINVIRMRPVGTEATENTAKSLTQSRRQQ